MAAPAEKSPSERLLCAIDEAFGELLNKDKSMQRLIETPDDFTEALRIASAKNSPTQITTVQNDASVVSQEANLDSDVKPVASDIQASVSKSISRILEDIGDSEWKGIKKIIQDIEEPSGDDGPEDGQRSTNTVEQIASILSGKYVEFLENEWQKRRNVWLKMVERGSNKEDYKNSPYQHPTFGEYISANQILLQVPFDLPELPRIKKNPVLLDEVSTDTQVGKTAGGNESQGEKTNAVTTSPVEDMPSESKESLQQGTVSSADNVIQESEGQVGEAVIEDITVEATPDLNINETESKPKKHASWWDMVFGEKDSDDNNTESATPPPAVSNDNDDADKPSEPLASANELGSAEKVSGEGGEEAQQETTEPSAELPVEIEGTPDQEIVLTPSAEKVPSEGEEKLELEPAINPVEQLSDGGDASLPLEATGPVEVIPSEEEGPVEAETPSAEIVPRSQEEGQLETNAASVELMANVEAEAQPETVTTENEELDASAGDFRPARGTSSYTVETASLHPATVDDHSEEAAPTVEGTLGESVGEVEQEAVEPPSEKLPSENEQKLEQEAPKSSAGESSAEPEVPQGASTLPVDDSDDPGQYVQYLEMQWKVRRDTWLKGVQLLLNKGQFAPENSPLAYSTFGDFIANHPTKCQFPFELPEIEPILLEAIANDPGSPPQEPVDSPNENAEAAASSSVKLPEQVEEQPQPGSTTGVKADPDATGNESNSKAKKKASWWNLMFQRGASESNNNS